MTLRFTAPLVLSLLLAGSAGMPAHGAAAPRNVATDEPRTAKGKPDGAPDYEPRPDASAGRHLALTRHKLQHGFDPARPFLIWAIGSSYTNMLGNGEIWREEIPRLFPRAPAIRYEKMVGNSCPWQYLRGWARHLVIPDQPDLVLIYTIGDPADLEKLIVELRTHTTADIIVPSIHWRERDQELWGRSENAVDQDVGRVREICRRHQVEFVENRRDWAAYLAANQLPIPALLKDAVHQSDYGARIINQNILAHLRGNGPFSYEPSARERRIEPARQSDGSLQATFTGNRVDLIGRRSPDGGTYRVRVDGRPAAEAGAFLMTYIQPDNRNAREGRGAVPRDQAPHGVTLGRNVIPQAWTITMTSDTGDFELVGSRTGADGRGNALRPFTSDSGQIIIEPELWRRPERNRTGDRFTFEVRSAVADEISFRGPAGERFTVRLAQALSNRGHRLELVPAAAGPATIEALEVYQPPDGGQP